MRYRNRILPVVVLSLTIVAMVSLLLGACGRDNRQAYLNATKTTPVPVVTTGINEVSCDGVQNAFPVSAAWEKFTPTLAPISTGSIVKWTNDEPVGTPNSQYYIVSDLASFNTQTRFLPGQSVCFKFDKPGTFPYHCDDYVVGVVRVDDPQ